MKRIIRILVFVIFINVVFVCYAFADIINIPADYSTIQAGINAASNEDTVLVQPGTYVENINYNGKNITVGSLFLTTADTSYISQTIIDGDSLDSVVKFENGEDSTAILTGFTITNGFARWGGGIHCAYSNPSLMNVNIKENSTSYTNAAGGGIYCFNSNPSLENTIINRNSSSYGGGLFCWGNSTLSLTNVMIFDNKAVEGWGLGGGIACKDSSYIYLKNVTIFGNSASGGGGILMADNSSVNFDNDNRCNIYLNYAGFGSDIFSSKPINVVVDTFTVINPTSFHANPIENFTFDILHGIQIQVDSDLYVSPDGDDSNDGLSWDEPLKTIAFAMSIIQADSLNPHTIHLSSGIFNQITNGEKFPVSCISYVSMKGSGENETILDANNEDTVVYLINSYGAAIEGITITNGYSYFKGGGISCHSSNPNLENVTISGNSTNYDGAGICCIHSTPNLINVTISNNFTTGILSVGGGIYCYYSFPSLENVTISGNTTNDDGGGIYCRNSFPILQKVTITGNNAEYDGGGIYCAFSSSPTIVNSIISDNTGNYGIYVYSGNPIITYSNFFNNEVGNFYGVNDSIGVNVTTNANGDSCDIYYNIQENPLFVNPLNGDYHLSWANFPKPDSTMSPCIDAGDPTSPLDPDGTIADMGAYYFNQNVSVDDPQEMSNYMLTNYPNPISSNFNDLTVSFSIHKPGKVKIQLFNIKGQLVSTLINEEKNIGDYTISHTVNELSSGIYFTKMSIDGVDREIRKMVLLR